MLDERVDEWEALAAPLWLIGSGNYTEGRVGCVLVTEERKECRGNQEDGVREGAPRPSILRTWSVYSILDTTICLRIEPVAQQSFPK